MAVILKDRVKVTATTTGTGTITLGSAANGYQSFAAIGDGNETYYTIALQSGSEWEVGLGTVTDTAGTFTLSRDTVFESSNAGNLVDFSAGTKDVFVTYPAERAIFEEPTGNTLIDGGPITVVGTGVTGYTTFTAALGEYYGDVDNYAQLYVQNLNDGTEASADFAAYNDLSDGETFFVDMGVSSSNSSSSVYPILTPNSGYVISYGDGDENPSELLLGSGDGDTVLFAGSFETTAEAIRISGADLSITVKEDLSVEGNAEFGGTVTLNANPTLALQAATKQYVDAAASVAFVVHDAVRLATAAALPANTYDNGTSGVGATLTANANGALSVDGVAVATSDRILVKNETTQANNGVYVVTQAGDGSNPYILTRASDMDSTGSGEVANNAYFFVTAGSTNIGSSWVLSQVAAITIGTTALPFDLFSVPIGYTVEAPLNLSGTVLSLTGTVAATNGGTGVNTVTTGDLLYGSATNTWSKLAKGAAYKSLVMDGSGTNVEWNAVPLNQSGAVSGALGATNGGTGQSGYALGDILYSSATNTLAKLAGNTTPTKTFLTQTGIGGGTSAAPAWGTIAASDVSGLAASATTDTTNAANITSGTLPVARLSGSYTGITGVGTLAAGTWNGSVIGAIYGGTGFGSYTVGDLLFADTSTSLAKLADVAVGNALISGGVASAPSWGKIGLDTHVSGVLPVANGGTGTTTSTGLGPVVLAIGPALTSPIMTSAILTSPTLITPALGTPSSGDLANCTFPTLNQNTTGNAATATTLQTARTIGGVSFNGSANINLPGVNTAGNQNTTGNAATASALATNGSANGLNFGGVLALTGSGATTGNSTGARMSESFGPQWNLGNSATWHHQVINGSMLCGFAANGTNWGSGKVVANSDMRATIFYDFENTGYYVDPASTSNLNYVAVQRAAAGYDAGQTGSFSCNNWFRSSGNSGWFNATYGGGVLMQNSTFVEIYNGKALYVPNQVQGTIFYDANDTAWYVDPNSQSRINRLSMPSNVGSGTFPVDMSSVDRGILFGNSSGSGIPCYFTVNNGATVSGYILASGGSTSYITSSDYRMKEKDVDIDADAALAKIMALRPVTFDWKQEFGGMQGIGFIAHELGATAPECVNGEKDAVNEDGTIKPQGIDASKLIPTLCAAIQKQQELIENLMAEVAALKGN
jgi:hypothetical protein